MGKSWLTSGSAYGLQDGSVYIKNYDTLDPFIWGGRCWRMEDSSETLGGVTVTTRFDPRGGIERDTVRAEPPGETSGTLVMKRLQADRAKSDLRHCYWILDQRMQCAGMDRDAWERWEEITRYCQAKFNERGLAGTSWEGDEDALVNLPFVALSVDDVYRVGGSENTDTTQNRSYTDIDSCQPERCPDHCDDQEDCVVVAVTVKKETNGVEAPYLVVNLAGGDDDNWTANQLATMVGYDAARVLCLGSFVVVIASGYGIMHSDDLGTTEIYVPLADVTAWAANHLPLCIDGIDQTFIVIGCEEGYITASYDAGRNWETVSSGEATTEPINDIMIARDNPQVIYASTEANKVVIKSENGGRTWFALGAIGMGGTGPTALYVVNQSTVLVGNDAGEVWQTVDGGTVWTQQSDLPGATVKGNVTINDITGCGCGILFMATEESGSVASRIYRNVDGGAEGRWYVPADIGTLTHTTGPIEAITCCGPNHAVGVGGNGTTNSTSILIE